MKIASYFIAKVAKEKTWFVSGAIRNFGHVALERCLDKKTGTFEFFVPEKFEEDFFRLGQFMKEKGCFLTFCKAENRFKNLIK